MSVDGVALGDLDDDALTRLRRERIGFVFQAFHVLPYLSVAQNVALPLEIAGLFEEWLRQEQEKERYLDFFPMPPERFEFKPARALPRG